jgi:hypothetical protein
MAENIPPRAARAPGSALDLPMSLFAAGSAGFAAFAMPADLFASLVSASGLPALVSAAQPPLGGTARLAFVVGSAIATFALVWTVLRALGKPRAQTAPAELADLTPRLRRADRHPDAPARAPIRAGSDLAVPLDTIEIEEREAAADLNEVEGVDYDAVWDRPAPTFFQPSSPESEPEAESEAGSEPTHEAEAADVPFWVPDDAERDGGAAQDEPSAQDEPEVVSFWPIETPPEPAVAKATEEPPIDQLVTRLEGGLIRRKRDPGRKRTGRAGDDRLRSALDELTRKPRRT